MTEAPVETRRSRWLRRLSWIAGGAILTGVIVVALRHSEQREIYRLVKNVRLRWMLIAFVLQAGTYFVQGQIWRIVTRAAAAPLTLLTAYWLLRSFAEADRSLIRRPRLLVEASACQVAILILDAATVWTLIAALGATASPSDVFASFMISTLFRIVSFVPGGLGAFEAASVLTLKATGVALPVALSATLLFRGLSFWLPMLPGLWFARRAVRPS